MSDATRVCKKCGTEKPLTDFYKHPGSPLGRDTKCKRCACDAAALNRAVNLGNPDWVQAEAERCRMKQARYRAAGKVNVPASARQAANSRYRQKYPEKAKANIAVGNAVKSGALVKQPCEVCGCANVEAHHDDYSKPLDVKWLCDAHHKERHRELRKKQRLAPLEALKSGTIVLEPCTPADFSW